MSNNSSSSSSEEFHPETVDEYLQRKKQKFIQRNKVIEDIQERSDSPVRSHPPPVKKTKYEPPSARDASIPKGFKRSTCPLGHTCKNALCYSHVSIKGCVWDRKKFEKPYIPPYNNLADLEREKKARRQVKALKKQK